MNTTLALGGAKNSVSPRAHSKPSRHNSSRIKQIIAWLLQDTALYEGNSEGISSWITVYIEGRIPISLPDDKSIQEFAQRNGYIAKNQYRDGTIVYGIGLNGKFCTLIKDRKRKKIGQNK